MVGLFTFHAYKSWMRDREEGYVRREEGVLPPDPEKADLYGRNSKEDGIFFDETMQRIIIQTVLDACTFQQLRAHTIGTDNTHIHILASWTTGKNLLQVGQSSHAPSTAACTNEHGSATAPTANAWKTQNTLIT